MRPLGGFRMASINSRSGGTGRHAILRGWWGNPWGFESPLRHHISIPITFVANQMNSGPNWSRAETRRYMIETFKFECRTQGAPIASI
jgi:hypothetical protein